MKWALNMLEQVFDYFRPKFEDGGPFSFAAPGFETAENLFFAPIKRAEAAPYIRDGVEIKRYMSMVIVALVPCLFAAFVSFGYHVLFMVAVSYIAGGLCEVIFAMVRKHEIQEGFLITGLIFPLVLPPTTPLWIVAVGSIFGVIFGKEVFGGTGRNIFNPALVGRLFVTIAFPKIMTTAWLPPMSDAITAATPLSIFKSTQVLASPLHQLFGLCAGSMGETFRIGIILGGLFLIYTRVSNWRIPASYLGALLACALLGNSFLPARVAPPLFQLLSGGVLFGAMFMATDPVSAPFTRGGKYIFGASCGILTVLIRGFSGYVEGVMFSIVIMNAFTPLIDHGIVTMRNKRLRP